MSSTDGQSRSDLVLEGIRLVLLRGATLSSMPSKHPRIAITADSELSEALEHVRMATGTREADATLVRRLALAGAYAQLAAREERRAAAHELFEAMDQGLFELDLEAIDALNAPADLPR